MLTRDLTRLNQQTNFNGSINFDAPFTMMDLIDPIIDSLPVLTENDINAEDSCPICLVPFSTILSDPDSGVTKLDACNHIFCRKECVVWFYLVLPSC